MRKIEEAHQKFLQKEKLENEKKEAVKKYVKQRASGARGRGRGRGRGKKVGSIDNPKL